MRQHVENSEKSGVSCKKYVDVPGKTLYNGNMVKAKPMVTAEFRMYLKMGEFYYVC